MGLRARILLPRPLTEKHIEILEQGLRKISTDFEPGLFDEEGWDFSLANGYPIRIRYRGPARRLYMSFYTNETLIDDHEAEVIGACFGWKPTYAFTVGSYETEASDHHLIGGLTLILAEKLRGLVDYCGFLTPGRLTESQREKIQNLQRMRGRLCTVNGYFQYHVSDPLFLRSWLQHPGFMMI
ncbi:MAG: DUF6368 family protein [Rhodothermales bacterium]